MGNMMEQNRYIGYLIAGELKGTLTAPEQEALEQWASSSAENRQLLQELGDGHVLASDLELYYSYRPENIIKKIEDKIPGFAFLPGNTRPAANRLPYIVHKFWIAAAAVLLLMAGIYWWLMRDQSTTERSIQALNEPLQNIMPGKQGAILTLADGRKVVLDSLGNGIVANENGTRIVLANGQLKYLLSASGNGDPANSNAAAYNIISTPKGRQFQIVLPDGTKVWLNAASTLRYPIVFSPEKRQVDITGEAYFEVAPSAKQPFMVNINGEAEVEVLGTGFNINAYKDEQAIKTTLVSGSVRVNIPETKRSTPLRPGQQAVVSEVSPGNITVLKNTDVERVLAWKNGLFNFEGATLEEVMKQLERWYDIEVVYPSNAPDIHFTGEMSNDIPLSDLLDVLKKMRLHFRLEEGRRLVVTP